jgi:hypothetical protein
MSASLNQRGLLWCIAIVAIVSISQLPPISQDQEYHLFADQETLWGIPNMSNVLSNLPFLIVGIYGLLFVQKTRASLQSFYWPAITFCIGVALVSVGSGYYHLYPNNATLVWDRLPMTIAFMGLYAMIVSAFVNAQSGVRLLPWLLLAGIVSVVWWFLTESSGQGDLRWYVLVQFLPMILTLVILIFFKTQGVNKSKLVMVLVWYIIAKVLELADLQVFELTQYVSGHALKHVAAAIASYFVIAWLKTLSERNMNEPNPA